MKMKASRAKSRKEKRERATAYHEAGHAVASYRFNHYGGNLTIVPGGNVLGSCVSEGEWADGSTDIEQIIVLHAGNAAEERYDKYAQATYFEVCDSSSCPCGLSELSDYEKIYCLMRRNGLTGEEFTSQETIRNHSLAIKARKIIDENWQIIEAIAEKLFIYKTLNDTEWSIIIDAFNEGDDLNACFESMRAFGNASS